MADDLSQRGGQDRNRINVNEKHEVAYWTKKYGVTAEQLRAAVAAVGDQASTVQKHLKLRNPSATKKGAAAVKKSPRAAASVVPQDAIALLRADHKKVSDLFAQFERSRSSAKKKAIVDQICRELSVHAQIEEEIFYPAVKAALRDKELVPEATVEHASLKNLISQLRGVEPNGEMYGARVKVLSEYVKHHVKEEQNEMFPKAKATRLDMAVLGEKLKVRKEELLAEGDGAPSIKNRLSTFISDAIGA